MKLSALASAINSAHSSNHSILLYGPPKTGKTRLVGTAAKIPEIERIFWFDGENGAETLLHMGLTPEEMDKIILYRIPDTREIPRFAETMLKVFSAKTEIKICDAHGKVGCVECKGEGTPFLLKSCTSRDLIVIDSGSQLGDSCLAMACLGKDITFKPGFDEWGSMGKYLSDMLSVIQAAQFTNFCVISHMLIVEEEVNGVKRDKIYPMIGTRAFSAKCAKYFGTVAFVDIRLGKHAAGSSSLYKTDTITGSRVNAKLESSKEPDMRSILVDGGILKPAVAVAAK